MLNEKEKESLKENQIAPKINEVSKKIIEDKNLNKDPVYQRLYNLRGSKDEKQIIDKNIINNNNLKRPSNLNSNKAKNISNHSNNLNYNANNFNKEKNPNSINFDENQFEQDEKDWDDYKTAHTDDNTNKKRNNSMNAVLSAKKPSAGKSVKKTEFINNHNNNNNCTKEAAAVAVASTSAHNPDTLKSLNFKNPLDNSNKFLFNKYTLIFRNKFEELFNEFISSGIEMDYTKGVNIEFLLQLLYRLKFFDFTIVKENNSQQIQAEKNTNLNKSEINNLLKQQEKILLLEIYENIRDSEGYFLIDHFYIFSLAILDLLDYYILKAYSEKEKSISPNNNKNSNFVVDKNLVEKINNELKSKIILSKKYGGYDEHNNYIITLEQSKKIHKDFNSFSSNWYKSIRNTKNKAKEITELEAESVTFKPKINPKSAKMGDEYRKKILSELDAEMKEKNNNNLKKDNLDYIEILSLKKKRQEK